jgi:hypothetical protein
MICADFLAGANLKHSDPRFEVEKAVIGGLIALSSRSRSSDMKKTRYSEEQIAFALRQAETGTLVGEVIRKMGISIQPFYRWKKQYGEI